VPEGDAIAHAARRIRPVLEGVVPDAIATPQARHRMDRWPERLAGRAVRSVDTHGKHLFLRFEGDLVLHSHLRMTGRWSVYRDGQRWRRSPNRAWLVLRARGHEVVEFDGPVLELMTEARTRTEPRLAALGPDVLAEPFDAAAFLRRLREDDPTRGIGDALLDQHIVAGLGNMWKAEACWSAELDPRRRVRDVSDDEAVAVVEAIRPRMRAAVARGPGEHAGHGVYNRAGRPCPRCGARVRARGQGDDNRTTFWCPGCQS
jgi:endonuclease VIII